MGIEKTIRGLDPIQRLENAALRRILKLEKNVTSVLVCPPESPGPGYPLKPFDILVKIGEHDIDNEGMVRLQKGFRVPFLCLVPQLAFGNAAPVTVLRAGRRLQVALAVTTRDDRLIRAFQGEQPSYFIHGPLVLPGALKRRPSRDIRRPSSGPRSRGPETAGSTCNGKDGLQASMRAEAPDC
jgi:hypothetical protein